MADTKDLIVKLTLENNKFKTDMQKSAKAVDKIGDETKKTTKDVKKFGKEAKKSASGAKKAFTSLKAGYLAAAAGLAGLVGGVVKSLKLFAEQEKAERTLSAAMKQAGTYTEEAFQHNLKYASSLQKMTTYGDEAILGVQKMLTNFGIEGEEMDKLTEATLNLAAAKGMDLKAAGDIVAKSVGSSTNALSRYGIEVTGAAGSTERANQAIENIGKLFGGAAAAEANTFAGKMTQLSNSFGDLLEVVGSKFAPAIGWIASGLTRLLSPQDSVKKNVKDLVDVNEKYKTALDDLKGSIGDVTSEEYQRKKVTADLLAIERAGAVAELNKSYEDNAKSLEKLTAKTDRHKLSLQRYFKLGTDAAAWTESMKDGMDGTMTTMEQYLNMYNEGAIKVKAFSKELVALGDDQEEATADLARAIAAGLIDPELLKSVNSELRENAMVLSETIEATDAKEADLEAKRLERDRKKKEREIQAAADEEQRKADEKAAEQQRIDDQKAADAQKIQDAKNLADALIAEEARVRDFKARTAKQIIDIASSASGWIRRFAKDDEESQKRAAVAGFIINKIAAITKSMINTRLAVSVASLIPPPFNIPAMVRARITGGLNTAAIIATPPPKFAEGGIISDVAQSASTPSGEDGLIAVQRGESVLNKSATTELGENTISALNNLGGTTVNNTNNVADGQGAVEVINEFLKTQGGSRGAGI